MTIEFKPPIRRGGAVCVNMWINAPVAEISANGATFELHFHPLASKLSKEDFTRLETKGRAEVKRMNALGVQVHLDLYDIAERLTS